VSTSRISLPERYRVVRHVANGGMASVWEAHDELLDRAVAVKLLASHLSEDDRARQRFQREARAAAGLSNHPNVVTIYDVGEHEGRTFMVMELLTGGTLADKLRSGDRIRPQTALRWLREAAAALDAAHEAGVVHRDVKPANMLLDDNGRLAIADFGIARLALEDQLTATGQVLGTAAYISPEQAVGDPASASSDRYALACVAFELLTGRRPFEAENFAAQARAHVEDEPPAATELNPDLPPAVDAVLARGLAKEPDDRWPTSGELLDRLEEALAPAPPPRRAEPRATRTRLAGETAPPRRTVAAPVTDGAAPPPAARPRRTGIMLAALAGLLALGVLAAVLLSGGGDGNDDPQSASDRQQTQEARETATPEATAEKTATPEPTAEKTATPEPTAEKTPEATSTPRSGGGATDIGQARRLQLQGFNARQAGNYAQALAFSEQALEACGNTNQLDPCGYALFEKGVALNRSGRSAEAIPVLERRLNQYGDNGSGEVQKELRDARKKAG
jgi:serine/threonine-protein kinase